MELFKKITCSGILLLMVLTAGCISTSSRYQGNLVTAEKIEMPQITGLSTVTWDGSDISINFEAEKNGETIDLNGSVFPKDNLMIYQNFDLEVFLFFLDQESRVLETALLTKTVNLDTAFKIDFSKAYEIPSGATTISFGYNGRAHEGSERYYFYKLPLRKG